MTFCKSRLLLKQCVVLSGLLFIQNTALAGEDGESTTPSMPSPSWSVGFAVINAQPSYRGDNSSALAVPVINFESERFYFRGIELGYRLGANLSPRAAHSFTAIARVVPSSFDPKENRIAELQQLDKRDIRIETGLNYRYRQPWGDINAEVTLNARGLDTGYRGAVRYEYGLSKQPLIWQFGPRLGVEYFSEDYVNYFYGISATEAQRSGLAAYSGTDSFNLAAGVGGYFRFSERWTLGGQWNRTFVDENITDSPMSANRDLYTTFIFVSYRF
ncbi:MipA/OmpV family protein [Aliidiomarina celeris]|uniref:MipA/OmpV family protein n=1 Tax=Aliidiomarina celeris TaxID=2249428 RepID=UPI0013001FBB|nr:MipA/OmpV family protein [Aliidiomarina celeris]